MYEYHGWITIRDTIEEEGEGEKLDEIFNLLQDRVNQYGWEVGLLDLRWINLFPHVSVAGLNNRKAGYASDIFDLYKYVAEIAPGSYGILYTRDSDLENKFRVYVLARGNLAEHEDNFLSPIVPKIEDPSS